MNPSDTILLQLIREKSLKFGDFTLASGKKATYYLDGKQVTLDAFGAKLIGEGILHLMLRNGKLPDLVGGMSIGADPITAAVLTMAAVNGHALRGCMIRKEPKGHGTKKYIEGPVQPGDRIIVLEDVVTTGGSSLLAMERLEEAGIVVDGVIAVIDRMEGGAETFRQKGCRFQSLLTIRDFGIEPPK
ncbi:MAG: orotate phosphoribosyltransferase [Planctomycetaceae bacterium]|nr:orotate phosphoribosyltransferase [Planctomycetaceae bacterium]